MEEDRFVDCTSDDIFTSPLSSHRPEQNRKRACYLCGNPCYGRTCRKCFTSQKKHTRTISQLKSSISKECKTCGKSFYGWGNQFYCSIECADVVFRHDTKERTKKLRKEHPEYYRKGGKYYNVEKAGKAVKKWLKKHPNYTKEYYHAHREKICADRRKQYRKHKEAIA